VATLGHRGARLAYRRVAGILPGIGATAGSWMAYGHVVAMARDRTKFGKGDIRGVIARKRQQFRRGRDFIPTLLFSVPGGAPSAILLARVVFLRHSARPAHGAGKSRSDFYHHLEFCHRQYDRRRAVFSLSPALARLTWIPFARLAPAVVVTIFFGAFQSSEQFGDIYAMIGLGLLGWLMKTVGMATRAFSRRLRLDQADRTVSMAID
jgi:TctA family transporter